MASIRSKKQLGLTGSLFPEAVLMFTQYIVAFQDVM